MKITKLNLYTDKLEDIRQFYQAKLGLPLQQDGPKGFSLKVGWTELSFTRSEQPHTYHYCFLIPSNQIREALNWMQQRVRILHTAKGKQIQRFETWNADSFYFYDGGGNLAECISRYDLENESEVRFSSSNLLGLSEIGMPTTDIGTSQAELVEMLGTSPWKGDLERFGTHGDQEGIFLLPNYRVKDKWFPTDQKIRPEPFEASVEHQANKVSIRFGEQGLQKV